MNKLFAVLLASALVVPTFAMASGVTQPEDKTPAKAATHKMAPHLKKASLNKLAVQKQAAPGAASISSLRDQADAPWVLPA